MVFFLYLKTDPQGNHCIIQHDVDQHNLHLHLDPDPPSIISVEYLSSTRAKITWKAKRCNFADVKKIKIEQAGSGVVFSFSSTNWDNETEVGYQIVENITVTVNETYFWNVTVVYGEGSEEATSLPSPLFEAAVVGKLAHTFLCCREKNTLSSINSRNCNLLFNF